MRSFSHAAQKPQVYMVETMKVEDCLGLSDDPSKTGTRTFEHRISSSGTSMKLKIDRKGDDPQADTIFNRTLRTGRASERGALQIPKTSR